MVIAIPTAKEGVERSWRGRITGAGASGTLVSVFKTDGKGASARGTGVEAPEDEQSLGVGPRNTMRSSVKSRKRVSGSATGL